MNGVVNFSYAILYLSFFQMEEILGFLPLYFPVYQNS